MTKTDTDAAFDKQLDPGTGVLPESYRKEHALQKASTDLGPLDVASTPGEAGIWALEGVALVRADSEEAAQAQAGDKFGSSPVKVRPATQADLDAQVKARTDEGLEREKEAAKAQKAADK